MPEAIPAFTNSILLNNSSMTQICGTYQYFTLPVNRTLHLSIQHSSLAYICEDTLEEILHRATSVNLKSNKLQHLSSNWKTTQSNISSLFLAGNPIECGCEMLWMPNWLENAMSSKGRRLVPDYKDVICASGAEIGKPVYKINPVTMGCYPKETKTWVVIVSCTMGGLLLSASVILVIIHHQWKLVRWLVYKNFDKLLGDPDRNEDISDMTFDAFISFRSVISIDK